ncbi:site-specific integrase [Staphylococcus coagulans]|uniref:tyrosine-type recombinase/integrase n=1 Tax=Staphylococcus coagulans TaxID=74706 RepID=UPI001BE51C6C|nr:tyrosine-type recombinase/integrase [Staphylococcus coagulans]ELJ9288488.1 tyrosine-type recombinase/integrase [Staphylococcus pseudintermedius]MBT2813308.1 site-specific integrase [Staphylococcus coagulans]MBT2815571.1 site-specific integrase [Staphylococcus coagulans]MBT2837040.1 site-specific integrase [Staphylococcus coagulans]MBT2841568.1 site-specific integrase [Staphylococcus coagulans]
MVVSKNGNSWKYDFRFKGKRYRKSGFNTKRKAKDMEAQKLNELNNGITKSDDSFSKYFKKWLEVNKEGNITPNAYNRYLTSLKAFEEKFGNIAIGEVTQIDYREFLKEYGEGKYLNNAKNGRTTDTVSKLHSCLKGAFEDAFESGIISRNPTYKANPKGIKKGKPEDVKFMSKKAYDTIIDESKERTELSYLALYILAITGARFGEVQTLRYEDLKKPNNQIRIPGTKTENADRIIIITKESKKHIQGVIKTKPVSMNGYIFNTGANLITNKSVSDAMQRILSTHKFGRYTLHALRHTHASVLLSEGLSLQYISKRLGHADIDVTLRTYSHLIEEQKVEEDEKLVKFMENY